MLSELSLQGVSLILDIIQYNKKGSKPSYLIVTFIYILLLGVNEYFKLAYFLFCTSKLYC